LNSKNKASQRRTLDFIYKETPRIFLLYYSYSINKCVQLPKNSKNYLSPPKNCVLHLQRDSKNFFFYIFFLLFKQMCSSFEKVQGLPFLLPRTLYSIYQESQRTTLFFYRESLTTKKVKKLCTLFTMKLQEAFLFFLFF
jgi:hypothetical protein